MRSIKSCRANKRFKGRHQNEKTFQFGHCLNYQNPPNPQIRATLPTLSGGHDVLRDFNLVKKGVKKFWTRVNPPPLSGNARIEKVFFGFDVFPKSRNQLCTQFSKEMVFSGEILYSNFHLFSALSCSFFRWTVR